MSEEPGFFTCTREEFLDEFVPPDDRPALEEARQKRALQVRAEYLTEMRKKAGLTQAEVAEAMVVTVPDRRDADKHRGGAVVSLISRPVTAAPPGARPRADGCPGTRSPLARRPSAP